MDVLKDYNERIASVIFNFNISSESVRYLYKIDDSVIDLKEGDVVIVEALNSIKLATFYKYERSTKINSKIATKKILEKTKYNVYDKKFDYKY